MYVKKGGNFQNLGQMVKRGNIYCFRFGWSLLYLWRVEGSSLNRGEGFILGAKKLGS